MKDIISGERIGEGLEAARISNIIYFDKIDSTNNYGKKLVLEGYEGTAVIVADSQYSGRGRMGKTWFSESGKGLYVSLVLGPVSIQEDTAVITLGAAVAVYRVLKKFGCEAKIKWPNDIVLDGKKVCGILTELVGSGDERGYLIIGIGVNVHHDRDDFPGEIKDTATSVNMYLRDNNGSLSVNIERAAIAREIIRNIDDILDEYWHIKNIGKIMDEYKSCCLTIGKRVTVHMNDGCNAGKAIDVTPDGKLVVELEDGTVKEFISGEVSVRGIMGYAD